MSSISCCSDATEDPIGRSSIFCPGLLLVIVADERDDACALPLAVIFPVKPGFAGLAITSAISLNGIMNYLIRGISDLELNMNAIERLTE
jgi:hypothetical protein